MLPSSTPVNVGYSSDAPYLSMAHPSNESSSTLVRRHQKRTSARRKNGGPARPMNAFMCFRRDLGQKNKGKKLNVQQLSQMAGETWRDLSSEQKAIWKAMADELKAEHAKMYPDYRFCPQRRDRSEPKAHSSASPSQSAESQRSVSDGADMMFTAVDGTQFRLRQAMGRHRVTIRTMPCGGRSIASLMDSRFPNCRRRQRQPPFLTLTRWIQ